MIKIHHIFLIVLFIFSGSVTAEPVLQLSDPWVRQAPPTAKNLAGYGELKNISNNKIKVVSITSSLFEKIEMHITTFENGMMRMAEVKNLVLKPGESVFFEPGGRHFMLIKPKVAIKAGLIVPIDIKLASGAIISFKMKVRR